MSKKAHACSLDRRQVKVTNLNYQPEKAGPNELVPRVDLSLEMIAEEIDLAELIRVRSGANILRTLWDKDGSTCLLDAEPLTFDIEFAGTAVLAFVNAPDDTGTLEFDSAKLKKIKITPENGYKAEVRFQLRVDPGEHLDVLGDLRIAQRAMFEFRGRGEDSSAGGKQGELPT